MRGWRAGTGRAAVAAIASSLLACGGGSSPGPTQPVQPSAPIAATPTPSAVPTPARAPNIVVVTADDLDIDSIGRMPNLKGSVADRGVTFANSFATTPLCCPSRASMLTGQYAHNHGVLINRRPDRIGVEPNCFEVFRGRGGESSTFATWIGAAGYRTAMIGKYLNRYPGDLPGADESYVPRGWDEWFVQITDNTYYRYTLNDNGTVREYGNAPDEYITSVLARRSVSFIRDAARDPNTPFAIWITPPAPHTPATAPPDYVASFPEERAPRFPNFNEPDISDKPAWFQALPEFSDPIIERLDGLQRQRLRTMAGVDDLIAEVLKALEETGQLENTFFIFTSDNGLLLGGHRLNLGKDAVYERSIRVPLIVRGPGVPAGRSLDHFALNIDLAPTIADLARAGSQGEAVDGRSLAPLLRANPPASTDWRGDFLVEHWTDSAEGLPDWFGVRARDQVYVEYPATREREYYDLRQDPWQLENQGSRAAAATLQPLQARLGALRGCRGAGCR